MRKTPFKFGYKVRGRFKVEYWSVGVMRLWILDCGLRNFILRLFDCNCSNPKSAFQNPKFLDSNTPRPYTDIIWLMIAFES